MATVLTTLIARDITTKLYAMNNKIVTEKGSHLDIRLPSITSSLTSGGEYKSPAKAKKGNLGKLELITCYVKVYFLEHERCGVLISENNF